MTSIGFGVVFPVWFVVTVAYSPWANGSGESLMRAVIAVTKGIIGEKNLAPQDWKYLIPTVAFALNEAGIISIG